MKIKKKTLDRFLKNNFEDLSSLTKQLPKASFLFVTYNRCPNSDFKKNPLVWAFQTLISNNKFNLLDDFVVVDDGSNDFTRQSVKWLKEKYGIGIRYFVNRVHKEFSFSRRRGIKYAKNNLVFMGDDDCLYSKNFILGSLITYYLLINQGRVNNLAVINLPVYERNLYPKESVAIKQIGKILLDKTFFYHNFDKIPTEYLKEPKFLDSKNIILKPFKVDTFSGVNLCNKDLILEAGNYLDLSDWAGGYSEHIELSYILNKKNYAIYHQCDPKISCIHLKYGANSRDKFDEKYFDNEIEGLKLKFGQLINLSKIGNLNTGARRSDRNFHIVEIGTLFPFYLKISEKLGLKFALKEYINFVKKNIVFSTTPSNVIKSKRVREEIWKEAIEKGCQISEKQTGKKYSIINKKILETVKNYDRNFSR